MKMEMFMVQAQDGRFVAERGYQSEYTMSVTYARKFKGKAAATAECTQGQQAVSVASIFA